MGDTALTASVSGATATADMTAFYQSVLDGLPRGFTLNNKIIQDPQKFNVCAPIRVCGCVTSEGESGQETDWAYQLEFLSMSERPVQVELPLATLHGDERRALAILSNEGFGISHKLRTLDLLRMLHEKRPKCRIRRMSNLGWSDDGTAFALQSGDPLIMEGCPDKWQAPVRRRRAEVRGTFEEWRDQIATMADGNPNMIFAISAGLAPPLLKYLPSVSGVIFHFVGPSSIGKTRLLRLGQSVSPVETPAEQNWLSTTNGLEALMQARNDHLCTLDELPAAPAGNLGQEIYMIANGIGKERANVEGRTTRRNSWRVFVLSSGEVTVEDALRNSNVHLKAGQFVRAIDIPVEGQNGAFDYLHGHPSVQRFLSDLDSALLRQAGTAGPRLIKALLAMPVPEREARLRELQQQFLNRLKQDLADERKGRGANEIDRVLESFATVCTAGEIGVNCGVLPFSPGKVYKSVLLLARRWLALRGSRPRDEAVAISTLREFLVPRLPLFCEWDAAAGDPEAARKSPGIRREDYLFLWPHTLSEALNCRSTSGHEFRSALEKLEKAGVLIAGGESGTLQSRLSGLGQKFRDRGYKIARSVLDFEG